MQSAAEILATLDAGCETYAFPMLDNGYVYLAATRLALFRSPSDWAMVIETFGYSPRAGVPDLTVTTFASCLHDRDSSHHYASEEEYRDYLRSHPNDDARFVSPIVDGPWRDFEDVVDDQNETVAVRGQPMVLPARGQYERVGVELEHSDRVRVYELARYLAAVSRDEVLATTTEQRVSVLPDMERLFVLDAWQHPDVAWGQRPSEIESFRHISEVLATGDIRRFRPVSPPNTHWKNWPDGGSL